MDVGVEPIFVCTPFLAVGADSVQVICFIQIVAYETTEVTLRGFAVVYWAGFVFYNNVGLGMNLDCYAAYAWLQELRVSPAHSVCILLVLSFVPFYSP